MGPINKRSHTAILKRPYLNLILSGAKSIECRLTRIPCPPFGRVAPGEIVRLKESGGPVRGEAVVARVKFFENLTAAKIGRMEKKYNKQIMGTPDYWESRGDCRYCSLIWLKDVRPIEPYRIKHRGMQAWLVHE